MLWGRFASRASEARYPQLWQGRVFGVCPSVQGPAGLNVYDTTGRGIHGTLVNMSAATDWIRSGGQYSLNFAGTRRVSTTRPLISGTQGFTLSAWVYVTGTTTYRTVCGNYGVGNTTGVQITIWPSTGSVPANAPTLYYGTTAISATAGASANQWNHVAATRSGNAITIFLNGVQVGSGTNSASVGATQNWAIGQGPDNTSEPMIGYIDDHAVYHRVLTVGEIRLLATRRGIAYEARRDIVFGSTANRRRRILTGMV